MTDRRARLLIRSQRGSETVLRDNGHQYDQIMSDPTQQDGGEATETESVEKFDADGTPLTPEQEAQQQVGETTQPEEGDDSEETPEDAD